jgi:hypothetical protein
MPAKPRLGKLISSTLTAPSNITWPCIVAGNSSQVVQPAWRCCSRRLCTCQWPIRKSKSPQRPMKFVGGMGNFLSET